MANKSTQSQQSAAWKLEAVADLCEDADHRQIVIYCASSSILLPWTMPMEAPV
jgi:hypothetical protein